MSMIFIINPNGARLCADRKFRRAPLFGTFPECTREYRTVGGAKRVAKTFADAHVAVIPDGLALRTDGTVVETVSAGKGFVRYITTDITDYILPA